MLKQYPDKRITSIYYLILLNHWLHVDYFWDYLNTLFWGSHSLENSYILLTNFVFSYLFKQPWKTEIDPPPGQIDFFLDQDNKENVSLWAKAGQVCQKTPFKTESILSWKLVKWVQHTFIVYPTSLQAALLCGTRGGKDNGWKHEAHAVCCTGRQSSVSSPGASCLLPASMKL